MTLAELTEKKQRLAVEYQRLISENARAKAEKRFAERRAILTRLGKVNAELGQVNAEIKKICVGAYEEETRRTRHLARDLLFMMRDVGFPCEATRRTAKQLALIVFSPDEDAYKHYAFEEIEL